MDAVTRLRGTLNDDPRRAATDASGLVTEARACGDDRLLSAAGAVLARARMALGEIDLALGTLDDALAAARRVGDPELEADARLAMAGALLWSGRGDESFAHLDVVDAVGSPQLRAHAVLQRAMVRQRLGDTDGALAGYERALPELRALGAYEDVAGVLMNRAVIRTARHDLDDAIADFTEAGELFARAGRTFRVAQTVHGIGWAHVRRGDLPLALRFLDDARDRFVELGHPALDVDVDRVEALLAAGLTADASRLAAATAEQLDAAGSRWNAAETRLLAARAARFDGDHDGAAALAERAHATFLTEHAEHWERTARLELLRATGGAPDVAALVALAGELEQAHEPVVATTALAAAAVAAAAAGSVDLAVDLAARCDVHAAGLGLAEPRVLAAHAAASARVAAGDDDAALARLADGLDDLHRHAATFGAVDARVAVRGYARDLAALGLRTACRRSSVEELFVWIERARRRPAGHAVRPPDDPTAAAELVELRAVAAQLRAGADDDTADLLRRQRALEGAVRRRLLHSGGGVGGSGEVHPLDALQRALGSRAWLSLADVDGRLVGVAAGERHARVVDLGPCERFAAAAQTVASTLRALVARPDVARHARLRTLHTALAVLDAVPAAVDGEALTLVVPGWLHAVPWHAAPSCAGRPVTVAPSATWWLAGGGAAPTAAHGAASGPAVALAGPRLAHAEPEAHAVAAAHPCGRALTGAAATAGAARAALHHADVLHVAAHARLRVDDAIWSSLELADGPVYLHELAELTRTPPVVVLSACEAGRGVRAGDELLGLAETLLDRTTRALVASIGLLPDSEATVATMAALHAGIAAGVPPAAALAALAAPDAGFDPVVTASIACFGA